MEIKSIAIVSSTLLSLHNMLQKPSFLPSELEPLAYPFLCILINFSLMIVEKFYPKILSQLYFSSCEKTHFEEKKINQIQVEPKINQISMKEISPIMDKMGLILTKEEPPMKASLQNADFLAVFEDSEPSLDEVKEAFSVFDMNKDGMFDARDLQRVLINLGIKEGLDLKACELMIEQHDQNGDGMIDLHDFSRLLEMSLF